MLIVKVLEDLGCGHVRYIRNKYVVASRPDGDNTSSVNVKITPSLHSSVYSRNDFKNKFETRDIYSLVQYFEDCDFPTAIQFVADTCGLNYEAHSKPKSVSATTSILRQFKRNTILTEKPKETPIEYKTKDMFICGYDTLFLDDGVSSEAHDVFEVGYDLYDNRIVFPIKNENGEILTFKGRTMEGDYRIRNIPKFLYYTKFDARYYLFGMYENKDEILKADDIVVVEPEKGVMQCYSFNVRNVLSSSKKTLSDYQVRILLKLGKPVVIAFDKDVTKDEILRECRKFKGLIDVYYIWDEEDLLGDKESPCDKGYEVWNELYLNRIKFEE